MRGQNETDKEKKGKRKSDEDKETHTELAVNIRKIKCAGERETGGSRYSRSGRRDTKHKERARGGDRNGYQQNLIPTNNKTSRKKKQGYSTLFVFFLCIPGRGGIVIRCGGRWHGMGIETASICAIDHT
jgi:hypothetical protein